MRGQLGQRGPDFWLALPLDQAEQGHFISLNGRGGLALALVELTQQGSSRDQQGRSLAQASKNSATGIDQPGSSSGSSRLWLAWRKRRLESNRARVAQSF